VLDPDVDPHRTRTEVTASVADLLGGPPALELTSSCTHAMEAAAVVLGLGPGDEVVVPAFTFPSTANAFLLCGASVRFADVDPATGSIDPDDVARTVTERTRVVVVTHYGGVAPDMTRLGVMADAGGWQLVEDAAHGIFASRDGVPLGRFGAFGALSFHRTKNLSAVDGGALVVNRPELVERSLVAIDKGTNRVAFERGAVASYEWTGLGSAWRMPDPSVAVLAQDLARRDEIQRIRHHVWDRYHRELAEWAGATGTRQPSVPEQCVHPAHIYWLVLPEGLPRADFVEHCARQGVQVARHYGSLPDSTYGRSIGHPEDRCPHAATLGERLVRLPLHHLLDDDDVDRVIDVVTTVTPS
jgi:dTDP-4-amino-4,6-dideoxygalactose transaminase